MPLVSIQNLLLALIVVVPGFISTHFAVTLAVVRTKISETRLLMLSLAASLFVDSLFLSILEVFGASITEPQDISEVFFTPTFQAKYVLGLLGFSVAVGAVGGVILAADHHDRVRNWLWKRLDGDRRRNFHEPWEGTLDEAARVQVLTSDGAIAVGAIKQYSDDGKEKQISLTGVDWHFPDQGWVDSDTDIELLFGEDIEQVTVVDTIENAVGPSEEEDPE
ncbi:MULTISPECIES: DUF6338 family protein [Halolamina]|uniref:Uncharacterized protein n=2 Tax=Halolamina TaxID=1075397 RepID=A0A1I5VQ24_9EURY|nr:MULTISPECIES: DUF6338 family protein [Halolamina]NHX37827.1 hypothetical protein [Halolamina sp. R1-12]SFQ09609.1 hypothetical protein SAMN05216277_11926 [Halolamina pelagica]